MAPAFATAAALPRSSLLPTSDICTVSQRSSRASRVTVPRAELKDLLPGIPSGNDARENAPLRYYVPRPKEDYTDRGFAKPLPVTWAGEVPTIGAGDIDEEEVKEANETLLPEDPVSTGALSDFARMMQDERRASLEKFNSPDPNPGRPTCGPEEGRMYVSNYQKDLIFGRKSVEYWGKLADD